MIDMLPVSILLYLLWLPQDAFKENITKYKLAGE